MRIPVNPFWVFVVVAVVVLVSITVVSLRRHETQARTAANAYGVTTRPSVPTALAALGLAVVLVPLGIAVAAIWGPLVGIFAYFALLTGGVTGLAASRRSRGQ